MLDPQASQFPGEGSPRELLERLLMQINLVEVLHLRLVGIQARRLTSPEQEPKLRMEAVGVEDELRSAQAELERLGSRLRAEVIALPPSRSPGF